MFKLNSFSSAHKSDLTEGSSVILMFTKCVRIMQVFIRAQLSRTFYWGLCFCFEWTAALLGFFFFLGWDVSVSRLGIIGSDSKELFQEKPNHFHLCLKINKFRFKEWCKAKLVSLISYLGSICFWSRSHGKIKKCINDNNIWFVVFGGISWSWNSGVQYIFWWGLFLSSPTLCWLCLYNLQGKQFICYKFNFIWTLSRVCIDLSCGEKFELLVQTNEFPSFMI